MDLEKRPSRSSEIHFWHLPPVFLIAAFLIFALVVAMIQVGAIEYAYEKMGVPQEAVFGILALSLFGSYVNIPLTKLPAQKLHSERLVEFLGMRYVVPQPEGWKRTVLAVNVGGALVPTLLSLFLIVRNDIYWQAIVGVLIVALAVHALARPVPGVGIAVPTLVPPLIAAVVGLLLSTAHPPSVAYVAGSLGTLIGADLLNLSKISGLGAPIASIGGAGTFDGIFLTGIIAVLLA